MQKEIDELSKFGTVRTCKIVNGNVVTIVLTDGFSEDVTNTFDFINKSKELFPDYSVLSTVITEENLAILVLNREDF